jgi:hypothetical protein
VESTDLDYIISLLTRTGAGDEDDESESDEHVRELTIHLLRLFWIQAWSQLESLEQETELLRNAPPSPKSTPRTTAEIDADAWRLDTPLLPNMLSGRGPLVDPSGKVIAWSLVPSTDFSGLFQPLRPFTILPGGATDRTRLQGEVFRPDHRLPTMSIDEYLEIERQRGNIVSGGGWVSQLGDPSLI